MINETINQISFTPLFSAPWIITLSVIFALLALYGLWKRKQGTILRSITGAALILILLGPAWQERQQEPLSSIAALIIDKTTSQSFEDRAAQADKTAEYIKSELAKNPSLELRTATVENNENAPSKTKLFDAMNNLLEDVSPDRRAGVIFITDGQVHDVPNTDQILKNMPIHALLTGSKDAQDRRVTIIQAPAYGITGQNVTVHFKVESTNKNSPQESPVTIKMPDGSEETLFIRDNQETAMSIPIEHAGQNIVEIKTDTKDWELTDVNNKNVAIINGVRDRLKVLLVSGRPHSGERTWRNLLTSDPGVDLVHFTILRGIYQRDATPQSELSLIPFPFRELFEVKLYDFDLIIFDNYKLNNILPMRYFDNIVRYVKEGGALLESSGEIYSEPKASIYASPLSEILPAKPMGGTYNKTYTPTLTEKGKSHPVTRNLKQDWAPWLEQNNIIKTNGTTLMNGANNTPLLILNHVEKGRVAQFTSDHLWLWAKGYKQGGPYADLSRRLIHWLMKEPQLDETALTIDVKGQTITVKKQNYETKSLNMTLKKPNGDIIPFQLQNDTDSGWLSAQLQTEQTGLHEIKDSEGQSYYTIIGTINPPEMQDIISTKEKLAPIIKKSRGTSLWLKDSPEPKVRYIAETSSGTYGGGNWIGLRNTKPSKTTSIKETPINPWISLVIILGLLLGSWWYEGKKN